MLHSIKVKKLFGRFDYELQLKQEGITIITGPNGYGKSTLLKIIDSIANGRIDYFIQIDFKSIELNANNKRLIIKKEGNRLKINDIEIKCGNKNRVDFETYINESYFLEYLDEYSVYNKRNNRIMTYDELFLDYITKNEEMYLQKNIREELKNQLQALKKYEKEMGSVRLISSQRLYMKKGNWPEGDSILNVIDQLPSNLKEKIKQVSSEYASVANKLDGTYTKRLLVEKTGIRDADEYTKLWSTANKKFEKLKKYQLVDLEIIDTERYNSEYSTALKIYFDDLSEKYAVFEPLVVKLDLFTEIINQRFLFKKIVISKEAGFKILDTDTNKEIKLKYLSSGEQQEIVLFYDLIFKTKSDLLLLIDEPEISLHVLWQKMFLNDLLKVVKSETINAIVATHSPQIIGGHSDMQIELGDLYEY